MALWAITILDYQINSYYENFFPGSYFQNFTVISTVELVAYIISGLAYDWFKGKQVKKLFLSSFTLCLFSAFGILLNDKENLPYVDMICNFLCKFGIASCYQGVYIANVLFPIVFASTTFGMCCMQGAIAGVLSPNVYQIDGDGPWYIFIGLACLGIVCTLLLKDKT